MMRASMGKAVSAIAAPMNSVALNVVAFSEKRPGMVSSHGVSRIATPKGMAMPAIETAAALLAFALKWSRRKPRPTRNMYRPTPNCAPT